jgi:hypothetical protein
MALLIAGSSWNCRFSPAIADTEYEVATHDGYLVLHALQHFGRNYGFCTFEEINWNGFRVANWPRFIREDRPAALFLPAEKQTTLAIPLWMPFVLLAAWVLVREWRRKRAPKGEKRPQEWHACHGWRIMRDDGNASEAGARSCERES